MYYGITIDEGVKECCLEYTWSQEELRLVRSKAEEEN